MMATPKQISDNYIQNETELRELRNSLLKQFKICISKKDSKKKASVNDNDIANDTVQLTKKAEISEEKQCDNKPKHVYNKEMFEDILKIETFMNCRGTQFEQKLIKMEKKLIDKNAKKHISKKCYHKFCNKIAPKHYPNNIYLCDQHKEPLRTKLEEYKIDCNKGTEEEKQKCRKLKQAYQKVIDSLKISDNNQTFGNNQHKYPQNYFSTVMAKLIYCHQELSKESIATNTDSKYVSSRKKLKKIVEQLMDLLICTRQNLNCHWCEIAALIISIATVIGAGFGWIVANGAYIAALAGFLGFFIGVIIAGFIFGDRNMKFVAGAAAVGVAAGIVGGGAVTVAAIESGAQIGAYIGTAFGPGPGTLAGAAIGGVVGGLFAGGIAAMYTYGSM